MSPRQAVADGSQHPTRREPIALVGIGCRFPGGIVDPRSFWELLERKVDAIVDIPADRWDLRKYYDADPKRPGKSFAKQGGFLKDNVYAFDPLFFGISPREAAQLDPQQRLLLKTTWEAIEDAGLTAEQLAGSDTGVFIGGFCLDQKLTSAHPANRELIDNHTGTSVSMTMLSNRISYAFDLHGPSVSIDTACSSSLVALHYACLSLWSGECAQALAGGVNVMTRPEYFVIMSKGRFLAPDARCRTWDARGAGYVRAEGAGVVVLKPLSAAIDDGDRIYAVIRGTGVNQDGATNGITVPNPRAQERLIRRVCDQAGVRPSQIGYVEAHGTGTPTGDPLEVEALQHVLSEDRPADRPCFIGSIKTNIGHAEAASGVAGLIKAALTLHHRRIAPNLHFETPNPRIPWQELCLRVPTEALPWPNPDLPALAAVNSFGYGGTNAHAVLEAAPEPVRAEAPDPATRWPILLPLSAADEGALRQWAGRLADHVTELAAVAPPERWLQDLLHTAAHRRTHHPVRATVVADSFEQLVTSLRALAAGDRSERVPSGRARPPAQRRLVFVCTGMGPQWWAMGRELFANEPVFREVIERCDAIFTRLAGWSIQAELLAAEGDSRMAETRVAQPANFVLQVGLAALWRAWGIEPDAIVGHSVGEVAAAYLAGALTLEDALLVSWQRSRLQQRTAGGGTMLAVGLGEAAATARIEERKGISIAAINGASSVTLSGDARELAALAEELAAEGVFHRALHVEVAYHSYQMDPLRDELLAALAPLQPGPEQVPLYSTVVGGRLPGPRWNAEYWWSNVRQPVRFAAAMQALVADGHSIFIELGPHPVLRASIQECLRASGAPGPVLASLKRQQPERAQMLVALGELHALGVPVRWSAVVPDGRYLPLPAYPWQDAVYRTESERSRELRYGAKGHVMLDESLRLPEPAWEVDVGPAKFPYVQDHQLEGTVVMPGAAYVEAGLAVHAARAGRRPCRLEELSFVTPLVIDDHALPRLHVRYDSQHSRFDVFSKNDPDAAEWKHHASGLIRAPESAQEAEQATEHGIDRPDAVDRAALAARMPDEVAPAQLYERLDRMGLNYGPAFRAIRSLRRNEREALVAVALADNIALDGELLHPVLLDACFQALIAVAARDEEPVAPFVPVRIARLVWHASPERACWCHVRLLDQADGTLDAELTLFADDGAVLAEVRGLRCQSIGRRVGTQIAPQRFAYRWHAIEREPSPQAAEASSRWLVLGSPGTGPEPFLRELERRGIAYVRVESLDDLAAVLGEPGARLPQRLLYLWGLNEAPSLDDAAAELALANALRAIRTVQALVRHGTPRLTLGIVTAGAQVVADGEVLADPSAAPLWGLGHVIGNEHENLDCKLIDLPAGFDAQDAAHAIAELASENRDEDIAFRAGQRFVRRLEQLDTAPPSGTRPAAPPRLALGKAPGTYLITGGTRGFGLEIAERLAARGAAQLVLVSRSGAVDAVAQERIAAMVRSGTRVEALAVDVSDPDAITRLFARIAKEMPPLRGIVHGAMVLDDAFLVDVDEPDLRAVFGPKVIGALQLHRLSGDCPLDFFVLLSSISSIIGNVGQSSYVAANTFLDQLAHYRRSRGLPATTINLGVVKGTGVVARSGALDEVFAGAGIAALPVPVLLDELEAILHTSPVQIGLFAIDWSRWRRVAAKSGHSSRFAGLMLQGEEEPTDLAASWRSRLAGTAAGERQSVALAAVTETVANVLRMPADRIRADSALGDLGMDSLLVLELKHDLARTYGVEIATMDLLKGPTVGQLATMVVQKLGLADPAAT